MKKYVNINRDNYISLDSISVSKGMVEYHCRFSPTITKCFREQILWIEYPFDVTEVPKSILTIPFVAVTMSLVWLTGATLYVNELDRNFYLSLPRLRASFQNLYPTIMLGGCFYVNSLENNQVLHSNSKNATLFSAGIDAISTYIRHRDDIDYLIYTNGLYEGTKIAVYESETKIIEDFADIYQAIPIFVKSNFYFFINQPYISHRFKKYIHNFWHDLYHSMAFLGCASVAMYEKGIKRVYIASSYTQHDWTACCSDPTTDVEFRFADVITIHDGYGLNRQQKTGLIVSEQRRLGIKYPLHVCSFNEDNDCICEKCFRTMLALVAECANPRDYSFNVQLPLREHFLKVLDERGALMGFDHDARSYWEDTRKRMIENYDQMDQEQKDLVDWFLNFDYKKRKRLDLCKYYRKNFLKILKRKIHF